MQDYRVSAGIILYQPELQRLMTNIECIKNSVEYIYIYNNGADTVVLDALEPYDKIILLGNGKNIGIAAAMNRIMEKAIADKNEWLITYDQDSVSEEKLVEEFKRVIAMGLPNVAIICPQVVDARRKYMTVVKSNEIESVTRCITSASCTNLKAWEKIGGFDEFLFIDLVDNDFCKRLKLCNWDILKLHNVILNQEFGNIELKNERTVNRIMAISNFIKTRFKMSYLADNIGKLSYRKNVSPMRVYYSNRNVIYLNKKFKNYGGIGYDCYKCNSYLGFQICFNLASFIRGKEKVKILNAIFNGMRDGIKSKNQCNIFIGD